jgi:hypothetical protein
MTSMAATAAGPLSLVVSNPLLSRAAPAAGGLGLAVLLVDTDRVMASIDERIYGLPLVNSGLMDLNSLASAGRISRPQDSGLAANAGMFDRES